MYRVPGVHVVIPEGFVEIFNVTVSSFNESAPDFGLSVLPFASFATFGPFIEGRLTTLRLFDLARLVTLFNTKFHLRGPKQTEILYTDESMTAFLGNLVQALLTSPLAGQNFVISKVAAPVLLVDPGAKTTRKRHQRMHRQSFRRNNYRRV